MQAAFTHKLAVLYNACLQEIGALQKKKSEMVEYLQSKFREEEIANKVGFASFLKKRSEPIEAGSPEHFKASYWIIRYSRKNAFNASSFHVQVGGTLQRLLAGNRHSTILSEMGDRAI